MIDVLWFEEFVKMTNPIIAWDGNILTVVVGAGVLESCYQVTEAGDEMYIVRNVWRAGVPDMPLEYVHALQSALNDVANDAWRVKYGRSR